MDPILLIDAVVAKGSITCYGCEHGVMLTNCLPVYLARLKADHDNMLDELTSLRKANALLVKAACEVGPQMELKLDIADSG